ncbi:unnamed protein product [Meloidogyne enterolobii]|uniref:Uncharacterized protein n=1 Tax=Meloidogyne enterolobii TaxID=390850 RepID=A0ACB0ZZ68_MELEN
MYESENCLKSMGYCGNHLEIKKISPFLFPFYFEETPSLLISTLFHLHNILECFYKFSKYSCSFLKIIFIISNNCPKHRCN